MSWFEVFKEPPLYGAALAFTAYGIHWFVLGTSRQRDLDPRPNVGLCVAYFILSLLGCAVFFGAGDWPVGLLFVGLALIYLSDFFASVGKKKATRWLGFWHLITRLCLLYLPITTAPPFTPGTHLPL